MTGGRAWAWEWQEIKAPGRIQRISEAGGLLCLHRHCHTSCQKCEWSSWMRAVENRWHLYPQVSLYQPGETMMLLPAASASLLFTQAFNPLLCEGNVQADLHVLQDGLHGQLGVWARCFSNTFLITVFWLFLSGCGQGKDVVVVTPQLGSVHGGTLSFSRS